MIHNEAHINALNVIRDLRCCKETVYSIGFLKAQFFLFFARPLGGVVTDRSSAPEFQTNWLLIT